MGGWRSRGLITTIGFLITLSFLGTAPVQAAVTQQVVDGGFDANSCLDGNKANCTNPSWTRDATLNAQNFFCQVPQCTGAPFAGAGWMQLGGNPLAGPTASGFVSQSVTIPAAPATLSYYVKYTQGVIPNDTLTVSIDGTPVSTIPSATAPTSYTVQTASVSAFATPGPHELKFAFTCLGVIPDPCGTYDIDSVTLLSGSVVQPPSTDPACDKAKAKLKKAKAKLKKLRKNDAKPAQITRAKAKVKKAKTKVKQACSN